MHKNAVRYLHEHKDRYSKQDLVLALVHAGYSRNDITESVNQVYGEYNIGFEISSPGESTPFWNFWKPKTYCSQSEKTIDFVFGRFLGLVVLNI